MATVTAAPAQAAPRGLVLWLAPAGVFALAAIGILWALPRPAAVCPAIYPVPPECATGTDSSVVLPFLVGIVFVYAAIIACTLLVTSRWRPLVLGLLLGLLALGFLIGVTTVLSAATSSVIYY
ncbi:MAG: hypothetical protein ABIR17_04225 [Pseudolysinimonas sp.]|uniref:hypothetical protein n=1 Tax=Pseudolysinimonas sp. TaxID=2680009 RepID=UPI0032677B8B